ncbi:AMP-binding protein [Novacetimonas pomaceti]|uniref:AMP-binding protein n=1 Tax=Novacetimonas pomaceti TaxID=2021998 RepID=UPI001C2D2928|nr:AMP-binding protein [Novacetimonas pomaceti]MBV1832582.1 AMP-binding protein [Novacetimonas pomaceti]
MIGKTYDNVSILPVAHARQRFGQPADYAVMSRIQPLPRHAPPVPNISALCIDRHLGDHGDRIAISWDGAGARPGRRVSYRTLHEEVCRLANALTDQGVQRGDRVAIHLPLMVESIVAVLACIRIGAVHVVPGEDLDAPSLAERLAECGAVAVLTGHDAGDVADHASPKAVLDRALAIIGSRCRVQLVLVVGPGGEDMPMKPGRDHNYDAMVDWYEPDFTPVVMSPDDPLFLLHPPGRSGRTRGVTYTAGRYSRLTTYAMDMLAPRGNVEIPGSLLDMAWNAGQTSLLVSMLAKGGTITIPAGGARLEGC